MTLPRVCVSMPCHRVVEANTTIALCALVREATRAGYEIDLRITRTSLVAAGREHLVECAMKSGAEWILWIDADQTFPPSTLTELLDRKKPFVASNVVRRRHPYTWTAEHDGKTVETLYDSTGIEEVSIIGLAVALTHIEVFRRMSRPWFDMPWRDNGNQIGEDVYFCAKYFDTFKKGPYIDHDLSKRVYHIGDVDVGIDMAELNKKLEGVRGS